MIIIIIIPKKKKNDTLSLSLKLCSLENTMDFAGGRGGRMVGERRGEWGDDQIGRGISLTRVALGNRDGDLTARGKIRGMRTGLPKEGSREGGLICECDGGQSSR